MNNEMTKCLTSLFNALNAKSEEEAMKMFGDAINHAKESKVDINNPEYFDCFINHKLKKGIKLLASTLHEPSICKDKNKPNFIYANYSFLENHIRNLCELREGSACCADKSRYILKMYLNILLMVKFQGLIQMLKNIGCLILVIMKCGLDIVIAFVDCIMAIQKNILRLITL